MGNNHQCCDGELPHKSTDQDWSLLRPRCTMAGEAIIIRIKAGSGVSLQLKRNLNLTKCMTQNRILSMDEVMALL